MPWAPEEDALAAKSYDEMVKERKQGKTRKKMSMDAIKPQMLRTFGFLAVLAATCELVLLTFLAPHRVATEFWNSVAGGEFTRWAGDGRYYRHGGAYAI